MDTRKLSKAQPRSDPMARAMIYRIKRDALMIVSNLNRGQLVPNDQVKRQLVFVQGQLCKAAMADPALPSPNKRTILAFHSRTVAENIEDKRGQRRRHEMSPVNVIDGQLVTTRT